MMPTIVADRLYGISLRPQELSLYGDQLTFTLRYRAIYDRADEVTDTHFKLMVLEIGVELSPDDDLAQDRQGPLQLLKCGWELELRTPTPCLVGTLDELPEEASRLLDRVADTVNELAHRAALPPPLGPEVVTTLLHRYRTGDTDDNDSQ